MTKDDIDAVSMMLSVNGDHAFQIYVTRGGLTQRRGSSDRLDPSALMIKGRTDFFEPFLVSVPESLLAQGGGLLEDGGTGGTRHDWRFEFAGGMDSLIYDVSYDAQSASLPDEFADMVVLAERLTHSWYLAQIAEETGAPIPVARAVSPAPAPKKSGPAGKKGASASKRGSQPSKAASRPTAGGTMRGKPGQLVPATKERIALAVLLDLFAMSIPYTFLTRLFAGERDAGGPPGAGLVLFAIVEFVVLMIVRRSPGLWLLGMSMPAEGKPLVDTAWHTRESKITLAVAVVLCWSGASGVTGRSETPIPYFGLDVAFLSILITLLLALGLLVAGGLILRTDVRGVWAGGGVMVFTLLAVLIGWSDWDAWVAAELDARAASSGRSLATGTIEGAQAFVRVALVAWPVLMVAGLGATWKRFRGKKMTSGAPIPQTAR